MPRLDGLAPAASAPNAEAREWLSSSPDPLPDLAEHTAYVIALTTAGYYPEDETGLLTPVGLDPDIVVFGTRPDWLENDCDLSWWGGPARHGDHREDGGRSDALACRPALTSVWSVPSMREPSMPAARRDPNR